MAESAAAAHGAHDAHHDDGAVHAHVSPTWFYVLILGALLALTAVTVGCALIDFGSWNTIIAVGVATMKASLVAAFFMHLRHDKLFNTLAFLAAFLFLALFLLLTSDDLFRRAEVDEAYGGHDRTYFKVERQAGEAKPGAGAAGSAHTETPTNEPPKH